MAESCEGDPNQREACPRWMDRSGQAENGFEETENDLPIRGETVLADRKCPGMRGKGGYAMGLAGIARYSASALAFSAALTALWLLARRLTGRKRPSAPGILLTAYLAALLQITALRLGLASHRFLGGVLKPVPLQTTLEEAALGLWPLVYNVLGNVLWFAPLGLLLPSLSPRWTARRCLMAGAALSVCIELTQLLLGTGFCDVDDVLFNALGALAGYGLRQLAARRRT